MRFLRPLVLLALFVTAPHAVARGHVVLFADGREMRVAALELADGIARLTLDGGGEIAVPAERILKWEKLPERRAVRAAALQPNHAWRSVAGEYAELIARAAERHELDPALLTAVAQAESAFDPRAVSPKGACGLLQLMPGTAERFGVDDVFDATQNVEGGARYLSWLLERFDGRTDLALAGYNAGEGAVQRYSGVPPYRETRRYVSRVLEGAGRLARLAP